MASSLSASSSASTREQILLPVFAGIPNASGQGLAALNIAQYSASFISKDIIEAHLLRLQEMVQGGGHTSSLLASIDLPIMEIMKRRLNEYYIDRDQLSLPHIIQKLTPDIDVTSEGIHVLPRAKTMCLYIELSLSSIRGRSNASNVKQHGGRLFVRLGTSFEGRNNIEWLLRDPSRHKSIKLPIADYDYETWFKSSTLATIKDLKDLSCSTLPGKVQVAVDKLINENVLTLTRCLNVKTSKVSGEVFDVFCGRSLKLGMQICQSCFEEKFASVVVPLFKDSLKKRLAQEDGAAAVKRRRI